MSSPVFILGGTYTDFARKFHAEDLGLVELVAQTARETLEDAQVEAQDVQSGHVGNFIGELTNGQGHLGAALTMADPDLVGVPMSRHEAACASGSMAILAAMADIEAERYNCVLVVGAEQMRHLPGADVAGHLGSAAHVPAETDGVLYPWPHLFGTFAQEYHERYGLQREYLAAIAQQNYTNAKDNPRAQTRRWEFTSTDFTEGPTNPVVDGWVRKNDCSQITDGAAGLVLASAPFARAWADRRGIDMADVPRIVGWGHTTAQLSLAAKLTDLGTQELMLPHLAKAFSDSLARAGVSDVWHLDLLEVHDCFTISQYLALEHCGLAKPGCGWQVIEDQSTARTGKLPVNAGGGLIGIGHPVGATGVRMVVDVADQVSGRAGGIQVGGARTGATLNIGGSATTAASFVVRTGA